MEDLRKVIAHLEKMLESSREERDIYPDYASLVKDAKKHLFNWQMRAALEYGHVLSLSERKEFARKALEIMHTCSFIDKKREPELQTVIKEKCNPEEEKLLREMCYYYFYY